MRLDTLYPDPGSKGGPKGAQWGSGASAVHGVWEGVWEGCVGGGCLWWNSWRKGAFCLVCIFHDQKMHVYLIY